MKRNIFFVFMVIFAFSACKKETKSNPELPPQESVLDYYPLAVGNYWLYEVSSCDSSWEDCTSMRVDSNYVSKDTLMNGHTYFKLEGRKMTGSAPSFIRDSLDYIVDNRGNILFSNKDFATKFHEEYVISQTDTIYHWFYKMDSTPFVVTVPLGEFICLDNKLSFFRINENFQHEFNAHSAYAKNVGPVHKQVMFASSTGGYKTELVGYNLQE
jgi:hypothetical protein